MREIEQMSQAETAECLGLKEETVKTRLHRARRQIESHLLARAGQGIRSAYTFGDSRCTGSSRPSCIASPRHESPDA